MMIIVVLKDDADADVQRRGALHRHPGHSLISYLCPSLPSHCATIHWAAKNFEIETQHKYMSQISTYFLGCVALRLYLQNYAPQLARKALVARSSSHFFIFSTHTHVILSQQDCYCSI